MKSFTKGIKYFSTLSTFSEITSRKGWESKSLNPLSPGLVNHKINSNHQL